MPRREDKKELGEQLMVGTSKTIISFCFVKTTTRGVFVSV